MTGLADQPLESALLEALNTVAAPDVRDAVVHDALAAGGLTAVPRDPVQFAAFVGGPLRRALLASLGDELGRAALAELEQLAGAVQQSRDPHRAIALTKELKATRAGKALKTAARHGESEADLNAIRPPPPGAKVQRARVRKARNSRDTVVRIVDRDPARRGEDSRPAQLQAPAERRTHPEATARRRILVSTTRAELVRSLASYVASEVEVLQCSNVTSLLQALQDGSAFTVVLVDCEAPGAKPPAVAALAEDFAALMNTVLLGADAVRLTELARISQRVVHWRVHAGTRSMKDIAEECTGMMR